MHLYYDYRYAPNTFDVAVFFANAHIVSRARKTKITHVFLICPDYRGDPSWEQKPSNDYLDFKVDNVAYAMARMLIDKPNITVVKDMTGLPFVNAEQFPPHYLSSALNPVTREGNYRFPVNEAITIDLYRQTGIKPFPFVENESIKSRVISRYGLKPYVTWTSRASKFNKVRNGGSTEELKFKEFLKLECQILGYDFIIIPDREGLNDFEARDSFVKTDIEAAVCLTYRFSLYSNSIMNVSTSTGPASLLYLSSASHYIFGVFDQNVPVMTKNFFERKGPIFGEQRPWSSPKQYVDWTERSQFSADLAKQRLKVILNSPECVQRMVQIHDGK